jgi:hypothetical protein
MKSKPKMSRFLWCLTLNHLTMIQMNKRRIAEGPLSIWIKLNELTNCVLRVLYGSFFASAANGQSLSCHWPNELLFLDPLFLESRQQTVLRQF